jgi:alpha-beta hydrolase superfamily lysophospholipase
MNLVIGILALLLAVIAVLVGVTRIGAWGIERRYPPVGTFMDVDGASIHYVFQPAPAGADLPPVVVLHGASANLNDQRVPLAPLLEGRAATLFFDRPGHGWSTSRAEQRNGTPEAQADTPRGG